MWESVLVEEATSSRAACSAASGYRTYLAVAGGIAVPEAYGSRATQLVAGIGGLDGRALERPTCLTYVTDGGAWPRRRMPFRCARPTAGTGDGGGVRGPHADPTTPTAEDVEYLFSPRPGAAT
ncbi:biotin-dependent carboxyltransferase family protein [Pseudonocardia sp. MCCB 268]|nr:biotin-dependent carboxyltransferase family protein [Pseudonocardia cytotoxica]